MKALILILFLICIIVLGHGLQAQTHPPFKDEHWNGHFGVIKLPPPSPTNYWPTIGSAFVFGPHKQVVTCAHVVIDAATRGFTNFFYVAQGIGLRQLQFKFMVPRYDLAVFAPETEIPGEPMKVGDFKRMRPGDKIFYYGFDTRISTPEMPAGKMNEAVVAAIGSALNDGIVVEFMEFEGMGIPGYSGGPVFNETGDLVAVMREAWNKQGVKGGPTTLMNRAFSFEFLRIPDEPVVLQLVLVPFPTNAPVAVPVVLTNNARMSLLDALDFPQTNAQRSSR